MLAVSKVWGKENSWTDFRDWSFSPPGQDFIEKKEQNREEGWVFITVLTLPSLAPQPRNPVVRYVKSTLAQMFSNAF